MALEVELRLKGTGGKCKWVRGGEWGDLGFGGERDTPGTGVVLWRSFGGGRTGVGQVGDFLGGGTRLGQAWYFGGDFLMDSGLRGGGGHGRAWGCLRCVP